MKKGLCLLSVLCCSFALTGCGTKTLTCTKSESESGSTTEEKITVKFKKDKPTSTSMEMNMKFGEDQKSYIDMSYNILKSTFDEMESDGVDVETSKTEDSIKVKIDVDFSKAENIDELSIEVSEDDTYENVKKSLTDEGYECK